MYKWDTWSWDLDIDFTLSDWLFGGVKLTKNPNKNKYGYSEYARYYKLSNKINRSGKNITIES